MERKVYEASPILYPLLGGSMPAVDEGVLTLSVAVRVSPEPAGIELIRRYRTVLNYTLNKILSLNLRSIKDVHSYG